MLLALQSAFGFIAICVIAWLMSEDRRAVPWRIVIAGALAQLLLAALLLWVPLFKNLFLALNDLLSALEQATQGLGHARDSDDGRGGGDACLRLE